MNWKFACSLVALCALLSACATQAPAPAVPASPSPQSPATQLPPAPPAKPALSGAPGYRCDNAVQFTAVLGEESAALDMGARGTESLLRDAGGITPQQRVYSNSRIRAEFGLGSQGREAVLRYLASPVVVKCSTQE